MNFDDNASFDQPQDEPSGAGPRGADAVLASQDGVVTLPPGASLDDISAEGRDLVITLADGSRIVVPDGAVFVPQIVIDGVAVPPQTVAQLLADQEPEPAAGPPQSSGGNFADDEGEIQAAFEIGDLLPFTDFSFPTDEEEEIFPTLDDDEPTIVIQTPDDPVGSQDAVASVGEGGLPARGDGEPAGTNEPSDDETTTGTIEFVSPDGPNTILINGTEVTGPGQTITTPLGTLTIVSIDPDAGTIEYSYSLGDNTTDPAVTDVFDVTVIDDDGDQASATLTINIIDDAPIAADDTNEVPSGSFEPITGDVLVNDVPGADGFPSTGGVVGFGNDGGTAEPGDTLQGEYGSLTLNPDGTYTYVRDPGTPGGVEDTFEYTITDDDGSTSTATLTISIADAPPTFTFVPGDDPDGGPGVDDGTLVDEAGLAPREGEAPGSGEVADDDADNDSDPSERTGSTIEFTSPDGLDNVTIAGVVIVPGDLPQTIVDDATGVLIVTDFTFDPATGVGSITYEYTLVDNTSGDDTSVTFDLAITDVDGDTATDDLTIVIADDVPEATDDFAEQPEEDAPVTIDVFANDIEGADSVELGAIAIVDGTLSGQGTLVYNNDGTFTYTPAPGEEGTVTFDYTITDGDGDVSTATVTIELQPDSTPEIGINELGVAGEDTVDEAGLPARGDEPAGSDADSDSETTSGIIAIDTGNDTVGSLVINGVDVTNGGVVTTDAGQLTVTLDNGVYSYTYVLLDNTLSDPDSDEFTLELTDSDGDTASTTLTINIEDDVPEANDDTATQSEEDAPVTVDVFANDVEGADGVQFDAVTLVDGTLSGQGTLVYNDDGRFTYTPAPGEEGTVTFDYTITDGDGDVSTATVTIELLPDSTPEIGINELGVEGADTVDEAGLPARGNEPAGSDEPSDSESSSGTIAIDTGNDTVGSLVINGVDVTNGGTITTTAGQLIVTLDGGVYSYTYDLLDNTLNDPDSDTFNVVLTDSDGDTASTTLVVTILDDVPEADDDANSIAAGEFGPVAGDVLANDTQGADGASVTSYTGAGGSGDAGDVVQGAHGTLTINADGTYTYVRDPGTPGGVTDTFTYTITDGDGDTAQADLVITIADAPVTLELPMAGDSGTVVREDGLAGPPEGSAVATDGEFTQGTFTFNAPDGPATVSIAGVEVTAVGQVIVGAFGTLTIDAISDGSISYTYELTTNTDGDDTSDTFDVVVTDQDGDEATGTLEIAIIDDVPTAVADEDSVTEDGPLVADGNVLTGVGGADANDTDGEADTSGADGASVTGVASGTSTDDVAGSVGASVTGLYGAITINADGSYSYELDNQNPLVQGLDGTETLTDTFTYTITDGDGDTSTTTVTITVNGADDPVIINDVFVDEPVLILDEDDLPDGTSPDAGALIQSGTFSVDSQDGLDTLTIGGVSVFGAGVTYPVTITGDFGTLRVTGVTPVTDANGDTVSLEVAYEYELSDNTLDHSLAGEDSVFDDFDVVASDSDGSTDTGILSVEVVDDIATATPDTDLVMDGGPLEATGNVITDAEANGDNGADTLGADGATVTGVALGTSTSDVSGNVGAQITGLYGTLTLNADGSYTYTLDDTNPVVEGLDGDEFLNEVFTYTITDGDGDTATTTLTIRVDGLDDPVVINGLDGQGAEEILDEDDLPDGSSPDAGALTQSGDFTIEAQDGLSTLTVGGVVVFDAASPVTFPVTIDDPVYGILTVTGVATTTDADGDVVSATVSYTYVLDDNSLLHTGANDGEFTDSFDVVATDTDGSSDTASLDITIVDDTPTAEDNANSVTEGATASGNVLTDDDGFGVDIVGADGLASAGGIGQITSVNDTITQTTVDASGNLVITTALGTLTIDAITGAYTYASAANATNVDAQDVFTYTIVDGDGDESTATLTIDISDVSGEVSDNDALVNEAGLATGSDPSSDSEIDADGQITVTGAAGTLVYTLLSPASGAFGTLTLNSATGEYTYVLERPVTDTVDENGANTVTGAESFDYEVRDTDGNLIGTGSIDVSIIDDVPTATDQGALSIAEDATGTLSGNVVTDGTPDTEGADGATVTAITIGGVTTGVPQDGSDAVVVTANGTYTIDQDGNWTFDPNPNLDHSNGDIDASFTYTLTDGDGDSDTATQPISITDGAGPIAGDDIALGLDDANLADGSNPTGPDSASDTIAFTPGSDDIASIVFGDVSGLGAGLTWVRVSDTEITGSDGGRLVVTLDLSVINNVATVTATLNDNFDDHPGIDVDDLVDLGGVDVIATDSDGDTASATVEIAISDDLPTISASAPDDDALTVDESDLGTDASADFSGLFTSSANADGPGTVGDYTLGINAGATGLVDTATGESVILSVNNGVVEGRTSGTGDLVFTVSVDANGTVTLDQLRAVEHADTNDPNDDVTLSANDLITLSATITDSDGDTATATANIAGALTFLDDGPTLSGATLGSAVDVDESDGLPQSDTSTASIIDFTADFGADGDGGTAFALAIANAASGLTTADGDFPITLVQTDATTITGTFNDGTNDVTAFTVAINADGTVTLTQNVALAHPDGSNPNDTLSLDGLINATVTITDGDGDTDSATIAIGAALTFFDDGPSVTLSGEDIDLAVSDTALASNDSANFAAAFTFDGGEDGLANTAYELAISAAGADSGIVDLATGEAVLLTLNNGVVEGRTAGSDDLVFTVSVDASGNVTLDQIRVIDHAQSSGDGAIATLLSDDLIQLIATATDNDGDTASATLDIGSDLSFGDATPTAVADTDSVVEGGTINSISGVLANDNEGADAPALVTGVAAGDTGADVVGSLSTAITGTFGTLTLNADGSYVYEAFANSNPPQGAQDVFTYTITDADGDTSTTTLTIDISDVVLVADNQTVTVDEAALDLVQDGDDLAAGTVEGSNPTSTDETVSGQVTVAGTGITYTLNGNGVGNNGIITLDADTGEFVYTLTSPVDGPDANDGANTETGVETFTYTATDANGNTVTGTITVDVIDDVPVAQAATVTGTVDEDGLADGIAGGTGDVPGEDVQATGSVTSLFVAGADGPLTYSLGTDTSGLPALTSGGVAVTYSVVGDTLTASAGGDDVFTFTLDPASGAWTFTLLGSLDHAAGADENDLQIELGSLIVATDGDGDEVTATGSVLITVDDDTPVAENDTSSLGEDTASVGGNVLSDPTADGFGADGAGSPAITAISGFGGTGTVGGTTSGEWGTLTLNADGTYTYDLNNALVQDLDDGETATDTFTYTIIDADGDPATATLTITIEGANDAPVVNADTNWTIEDAAAAITGNVLQDVDHSGAPDGAPRGDAADTDVDGDSLSVTTVGTFTGQFGILTLNSDGSYSYELFTEAQNQAAFDAIQALDEGDAPVTDTFNYSATDGDATSNSTLTISIFGTNDAPVVGSATVATSDEGLAGGLADSDGDPTDTTNSTTASGVIAISDVDDSTFTVTLAVPTETLTSGGETIVWSLSSDGKTLTGSTTSAGTVLTVAIDDTGAFTVTQLAQIDHPDTTGEDVTGFTVDVNVDDGTTTTTQTAAITVNIEDDSPEITAPIADQVIDNDPSGAVLTDDLNLAGGGDGLDPALTIAADTSLLFVGGEPVVTSQEGNVLTGFVDADGSGDFSAGDTAVFTLTVDPDAGISGQYEFDLLTTLDNGQPGVPLDIGVTITATDADDDSVSDNFTLTINDGPIANDDNAATEVVQEDINAAFVLDFSGSVNNSELNLQLNAVKDAAFELFESTTGSVDITLITFSGTAQLEGTFDDFAAFAAALDGLNNQLGGTRSFNGGTDFTDAINQTIADFTPDPNANNQVFFLSDGNPNQQLGPGGTSLTTATANAWQNFVDDNDVNVTAIGVGGGINNARLQDIDVDGEGEPVLADDFEDLIATLISVVTPAIGGNILDNDVPSSNGIASVAITIDGITYTFDGVDTITPSSGPPISGTVLTVTTAFGGEFSLDFSDGSYTYEPPQVPVPEVEVFNYVVTDSDGDSDSATLTIDIAAVSADPNFAKNDVVITNRGTTVAIDEAWLLANDDPGTSIAGVGNASSGSVSRGGGTTTFIDTGDASGGFTYTGSDGSGTNNAFVTVNRDQAGEFNLDGTSGDDILLGRNVADDIEGDDGDDILIGGGGNDTLDGGEGADILTGGAGNDDFDFADGDASAIVGGSGDNGTITGFDTITDFNISADDIDFNGTAVLGATTSGTNGTDSDLTINGQTVKSHAVSNGIITFDDQNNFANALTLTSDSDVAAVVDYLQNNDIGSANSTVAFVVGSDTYIYFQDNGSATPDQDNLVKLEGVTVTDLSALIGTAIFPVVLDLDGDGVEFVGIDAGVTYDYDGDGSAEATSWVGADDAILAFDANSDGTVTDASEFVFGGNGFTDLEAVAARYDTNGDGALDAADAAYSQFGIWQDANLNGLADEGEFTTLAEAGIASIGLISDEIDAEAANDEVGIFGKSVFTFADGRTGEVADTTFTTERQSRTQEHALVAAAGFAAITTLPSSNDRAPLEQIEFAAFGGFDYASMEPVAISVEPLAEFSTDGLLRSTTDIADVFISANLLSGNDGTFATSDIASGSALPTSVSEPIQSDEASWGVEVNVPTMASSGGSDVAQAMEALLLMENAALDAADTGNAELEETFEAVLSDIAIENQLDEIIEKLAGSTEPQEYLASDLAVLDEGLLNQTLEMSINPVEPIHVMDGQLDQATAAAVPA